MKNKDQATEILSFRRLMNLLNTLFSNPMVWSLSHISFDNLQAATDFALSTLPDETIYLDDEEIEVGQWVARSFGIEYKIPIIVVNDKLNSWVQMRFL